MYLDIHSNIPNCSENNSQCRFSLILYIKECKICKKKTELNIFELILQDFSKMASGYCSSNSYTEVGLHYTYILYIWTIEENHWNSGYRSLSESTSGKSKQCKWQGKLVGCYLLSCWEL